MGTYKKKNIFARTEPPLRCRPQYHKILAEKGPHRRFPLPDKTAETHGKTQEKRTTDRTGETPGRKPAAQSRECAAKKSEGLSRGKESPGTREWAKAIDELRPEYPLDLLLKLKRMARSVFYYHLKHLKDKDKYAHEKELIKSIYHEHKGRYGYRRVTAEMRNRGFTTNHKTVRRLMDEMELKSRIRKVRYRSYRHQSGKTAPNIIARNFRAEAPNRKWATDVTQINIGPAKLYLSPIIDMFNGEIISYNLSETPNMEQIYDMLDKAFSRNDDLEGLILHSDQGWQYQHYGYRQRLEERNVLQSMSRKGNCLDNAMAESFFAIMKSELLYAENFESPEAFTRALEEYIDYYNHRRIKSRLKGKSPVQYRTLSITG
ncbi:hypothetical protein Cop2CBH44_31780 [Coprobacter secundus subsp. similis]|uniref:Integrase catalytic domain-containing protein n=1 Tax=Coprobacter secundus subsp. similis TaxID=2751153 RepID=A0A7G1HYQ7_9BACT|nr:hypothetical protein Cop2CBH44_31780 [Coprobacter secundus subsp. similis]